MLLSVLIPYFNEPTLIELLNKLYRVDFGNNISIEVIAIDDGSTDDTTEQLLLIQKDFPNLTLNKHSINKGKGAAIKTGLTICTGDIVIIQDADLEYLPDDIPLVIKPIIDNKTLVCYGSRHLDKGQSKKNKIWFRKHLRQTLLAFLGAKIITSLCNILFSSKLTDVPTCYKAFETKLLKEIFLNNNGFELEAEITAKVLKKTSIIEVPIHYFPRTRSEGKKICWRDGFKFLFNLIKYRFVS